MLYLVRGRVIRPALRSLKNQRAEASSSVVPDILGRLSVRVGLAPTAGAADIPSAFPGFPKREGTGFGFPGQKFFQCPDVACGADLKGNAVWRPPNQVEGNGAMWTMCFRLCGDPRFGCWFPGGETETFWLSWTHGRFGSFG